MKNIYEQIVKKKFKIDRIIPLEKFRRFLIYACYFPNDRKIIEILLSNKKFFLIREGKGKIEIIADEIFPYIFRENIAIVNAKNIKEIHYNSKSGNTRLKWIKINEYAGRLIGVASFRTLMNFYYSKMLPLKDIMEIMSKGD